MEKKRSLGITIFSIFVSLYGFLTILPLISKHNNDLSVRFSFIVFILGMLWLISGAGLLLRQLWGRNLLLLTSLPLTFAMFLPFVFILKPMKILVLIGFFILPAVISIYILTRNEVRKQFDRENKIIRPYSVTIFGSLLGLIGVLILSVASLGFVLKQISYLAFLADFLVSIILILSAKGIFFLVKGVRSIVLIFGIPVSIIVYPLYLFYSHSAEHSIAAFILGVVSVLFGVGMFFYLTNPNIKKLFK
ncbi:MAG: hypothetical protein PHP17_01575 [Candidatus Omnitrophica bacterium]|nr:hypothetical protein [Candidatus Omnitrophota bacterium]